MSFKYKNDFGVFILSHGRANTITTVNMLKKGKYSGDWFVVIDDEDGDGEKYKERFKNHVIVFDKKKEASLTDLGDNGTDRRIGVLARNAIMKIVCKMGYKYHLQLDDDYSMFQFRYNKDGKFKGRKIENIDRLFELFIDYLSSTKITCLACSVGGDYIGGGKNHRYYEGLLRKCMNTFFIKTEDPLYFSMRMNDDVTTNVLESMRGRIFLSCTYVQIIMKPTQAGDGGMTDIYLDSGTYWKSFYTLMAAPSCSKITMMGTKRRRIHHKIMWNNCCPKIISEKYKKTLTG